MFKQCLAGFSTLVFMAAAQAATIDTVSLTASGLQAWANNSAGTLFTLKDIQPAGSGVFDPFARIQNTGNQQGYNTTEWGSTMDNKGGTGVLEPIIPLNSKVLSKEHHVTLLLDYNEPGSGSKATVILEDLKLIVSTNPNKGGPENAKKSWTPLSVPNDPNDELIFDMATLTNNATGNKFRIMMDARDNLSPGNGGSGVADLAVKIDLSTYDFTGKINANHYLYVYSRFSEGDAGFEEWRAVKFLDGDDGGGGIPEPASLGVLGLGCLALLARRR